MTISRRDMLKGLGATGLVAATGIALAQPAQATDYGRANINYMNDIYRRDGWYDWEDAAPRAWGSGTMRNWSKDGIDREYCLGSGGVHYYSQAYDIYGWDEVKIAQRMLNCFIEDGQISGPLLTVDGLFGPSMESRTMAFQKIRFGRLTVDGIIGRNTWEELAFYMEMIIH